MYGSNFGFGNWGRGYLAAGIGYPYYGGWAYPCWGYGYPSWGCGNYFGRPFL